MAFTGKQILGIGVATAIVTSLATTVIIHNAKKIHKFKNECNEDSKKKKNRNKK